MFYKVKQHRGNSFFMSPNAQDVNLQIKLKITNQLYLHSPFAILSTIFNTIFVVIVFHNITNHSILFSWAGISIIYLLIRYFFCHYVIKQGLTLNNLALRLKQFTITICISGIIFGSAGILFLSENAPTYNSFIFFLMGGMFAGSAGAYAINQRVFYAFSAPVFLPVLLNTFILGGTINLAMSLMGVVFMIMMVGVVKHMNITIIEAYTLSVENIMLAKQTKCLNQKLKLSNDNLEALSYKDTMTNIYNRRYITNILEPEINRFAYSLQQSIDSQNAIQKNVIYGVFIIDIDHFKNVNDTWGHKCGDEMIIQFVTVIQSLIREEDILCRWGGEEFVIILKQAKPEYIHHFSQKLLDIIRVTQFKMNDSTTINKTCSLGYAQFPFIGHLPTALTLDQTIEIADQALYHAKENGRNKAILAEFNSKTTKEFNAEETRNMLKDISNALKTNNILLSNHSQ